MRINLWLRSFLGVGVLITLFWAWVIVGSASGSRLAVIGLAIALIVLYVVIVQFLGVITAREIYDPKTPSAGAWRLAVLLTLTLGALLMYGMIRSQL